MELTFDKATGICEFEVTADFNLHLEREDVGTLHFYQRTTPHGEYDYIKNQGYNADDKVIDLDFQSLVYPKWIKIKSAIIPTVATISTDGEVREVSYQAKDIEITSNGTTKVTADTGYTALGSVNVKVNVPTEGGSGGNCEEQQVEYWEFISWDEVPDNPIIDLHGAFQDMMFGFGTFFATVLKSELDGEIKYIEPLQSTKIGNPIAACVIPSKIIQHELYAPEPMTIEQSLNLMHSPLLAFGVDWRFIIKRKITREEFYADMNTDDTYVSKVVVGPAPGMPDAPAVWLDVNTGSIVKNVADGLQVNDINGKKMIGIPQNFGYFSLYSPIPIEPPRIIDGDIQPYSADKQWYGATTQNLGTMEFELPFGSLVIEVYNNSQEL